VDGKIVDLSDSSARSAARRTPADRKRIDTRVLPTAALEQILALCAIPRIAVSDTLVAEAQAALRERQQQ